MALAGVTKHPDAVWMEQMARNAVDPESGHLRSQRYILHDRDTKFLRHLSIDPRICGHEMLDLAAAQSELECVFGARGEICERGMSSQADPVR